MNTFLKRAITLFLCAVLILGQVPMGAKATGAEEVIVDTFVHVNPAYADEIKVEELIDEIVEVSPAVELAEKEDYATTMEEVVIALREMMKKRTASCVVYLRSSEYDSTLHSSIFHKAIEHTGNPTEGDYLERVYGGYSGQVSRYQSGGYWYITFTYNMKYYTTAAQEAKLDTEVTKLLNKLNLYNASDYEKVRGIYDYICANIEYDYDNLYDDDYKLKYTAYAALVNKTSVCQGYATLFYRLALTLGVDCRYVSGYGNGGSHGWNIVKIGSYYYCLDSTWDAGNTKYKYFLKCEANFGDHTPKDEWDWAELGYNISKKDYVPGTEVEHTHAYDQKKVDPKYLVSEATCTEQAVYYKSCQCGAAGKEKFKYGDLKDHVYDQQLLALEYLVSEATCTEQAVYHKSCKCGAEGTETFKYGSLKDHVYDQEKVDPKYLVTEATCTEQAVYYKSCKCGVAGTETFKYGDLKDHVYDQKKVAPEYLVSEATSTSPAVYRKSCVCGAAGEETFNVIDPKPPVTGELPKLGSATNLTWGVVHGWNWDIGDKPYHDPAYDSSKPGVASFKPATLDQGTYETLLYKVGETWPIAGYLYEFDDSYYNIGWAEENFVNYINESGVYYFTVTALGDGINYADGPTVRSENWTYVKPAKQLTAPTKLSWEWPDAVFNVADSEKNVMGAYVEFYHTPVLGEEPEWAGASTYFCFTNKVEAYEWMLEYSGYGYYSFKVMLLSNDITTVANSEWSAMSPVYHFTNCTKHDWKEATCTEPKTCKLCGATEGTTIPHTYDQKKVDSKYLVSEATCTEQAVYLKSCKCGAAGTETFKYGSLKAHVYDQKKVAPEYLVSAATSTSPAVYKMSCVCGKAGTETFKQGAVKPQEFKDVPKKAYYYDAVMWAVENGVTSGTGDGTTFAPDSICSRAQVVTFLWRAAGEPEPKSMVNPFKDVKSYDYFYKAVLWAVENKITTGVGDGTTFAPNSDCNRAQIVTFLSRAKNGIPFSNENPFKDVPTNAYYYNPVLWAVQNGVTTGTGDGTTFEPNKPCTRGQVITFLWRAYTK